jgi:hypothetical protein
MEKEAEGSNPENGNASTTAAEETPGRASSLSLTA